jgi:prophage regulatory protein
MSTPSNARIVRMRELIRMTGLPRSHIYRLQAEGRFPRSVKLDIRSVGWLEQEVIDWLDEKIASRDAMR